MWNTLGSFSISQQGASLLLNFNSRRRKASRPIDRGDGQRARGRGTRLCRGRQFIHHGRNGLAVSCNNHSELIDATIQESCA